MTRTPFEAATRCDFDRWMSREKTSFPVFELVIDVDSCACGLCRCDAGGAIALLGEVSSPLNQPLSQTWVQEIEGRVCRMTDTQRAQLLGPGAVQSALLNFYKSRKSKDGVALRIGDTSMLCSSLDEAFQPAKEALGKLLDQAMDMLDRFKVDEDDIRVLMLGQLAGYVPARLAIRSAFTFDPFITDNRFIEPDDEIRLEDIVPVGMELLERSEKVGFDLTLQCLDEWGREAEAISLAGGEQLLSTLDEPTYSLPIFACDGDTLRFRRDGAEQRATVSMQGVSTDGALVEVACGLRGGKPAVLLRSATSKSGIAEIVLHP